MFSIAQQYFLHSNVLSSRLFCAGTTFLNQQPDESTPLKSVVLSVLLSPQTRPVRSSVDPLLSGLRAFGTVTVGARLLLCGAGRLSAPEATAADPQQSMEQREV